MCFLCLKIFHLILNNEALLCYTDCHMTWSELTQIKGGKKEQNVVV